MLNRMSLPEDFENLSLMNLEELYLYNNSMNKGNFSFPQLKTLHFSMKTEFNYKKLSNFIQNEKDYQLQLMKTTFTKNTVIYM